MEDRGLNIAQDRKEWVGITSSRKVASEDFEEVVDMMRSM